MMETSFSGSEGELDVSLCSWRNVIQRTLSEEMRFSNSDSDVTPHSERSVIQNTLAEEMSFFNSDNSQNLSRELLSEEEYDGPMNLPCEMCQHFLYTHFACARGHKALLDRIMAEPGQRGFSDTAKSHIQQCCLGFYANLDSLTQK